MLWPAALSPSGRLLASDLGRRAASQPARPRKCPNVWNYLVFVSTSLVPVPALMVRCINAVRCKNKPMVSPKGFAHERFPNACLLCGWRFSCQLLALGSQCLVALLSLLWLSSLMRLARGRTVSGTCQVAAV